MLITHDLGEAISLSDQVFVLTAQPATVFRRFEIPDALVNQHRYAPLTRTVDNFIHRLRHKVDEGFASRLIHTVPGAG